MNSFRHFRFRNQVESFIGSFFFVLGCFIFSSLLFLMLKSKFLFLMLKSKFIALILIVIYVVAISVLFLFSVMMLGSKEFLQKNLLKYYFPVGILFCFAFISPILSAISIKFQGNSFDSLFYLNSFRNWYDFVDSNTDIEVYSQILYSYYVLQLLVQEICLVFKCFYFI